MPDVSSTAQSSPAPDLMATLTSRGYHAVLFLAGLVGAPIGLLAFGFLAVVSKSENWVWQTLPSDLGWSTPPGWYAILAVGLAGLLVGLIATRLPGGGGHLPVQGLGGNTPRPVDLGGIALAALASLVLGAVVGPEAPLTALGGGLVGWAVGRTKLRDQPQAAKILVVAGSSAAIATIFGNPLVAVVLMLEVVGFASGPVLIVILPAAVASATSGLILTGLSKWTGIALQSLTIPGLQAAHLDWEDVAWAVPIAVLAAAIAQLARRLGLRTASTIARHPVILTSLTGLLVGGCAAVYTWSTDRPVTDVLRSGQAALPGLVSSPHSWAVSTLLLLLVLKGLGYGLSLGSFRGGPTFPAVFLGAALGILLGPLPGLGTTAGIGIAMAAATTAMLRLPVTSVVLVVLLLGNEAASEIPVIMLSSAVALVTAVALDRHTTHHRRSQPAPAQQSAAN
ncbi:MAG TPA: chloride channel protein [Jatrophihabitans sp.]|nr:chloride channel protein [Jatrophihabitans sp.]